MAREVQVQAVAKALHVCCALRQDTSLSQFLLPPRCILVNQILGGNAVMD